MSAIRKEMPDDELVRLVAALCDECLSESDRRKLEARLREDPDALRYCAERIRFESELAETMSPPRKLEWSETRKLVRDGSDGWELRLEQSLRFGSGHRPGGLISRIGWGWVKGLGICIGGLLVGVSLWLINRQVDSGGGTEIQAPLVLKNGDFEEPGLERSASPESFSIVGWQDYHTSDAKIVEIARMTDGKILPQSGRNVVRLEEWDFLTQILYRKDGSRFVAVPGKGIRVSGWAFAEPDARAVTIEASLRYVASPHPSMCQYVPAYGRASITAGKWQRFVIDLVLPHDLVTNRVTKGTNVPFPEELDVTGKEMTLSIDNRVRSGGTILIDNISVEEMDPED